MGGIIVTAVLASLIAGGGVYIFYPDLKNLVTPKKKAPEAVSEEPKVERTQTPYQVFRKRYTESDELLEIHAIKTGEQKLHPDFDVAKAIDERNTLLIQFMTENLRYQEGDKEGLLTTRTVKCPVCQERIQRTARYFQETCACEIGEKLKAMNAEVLAVSRYAKAKKQVNS